MRKNKHEKVKFKIIEIYSVLILIATIFMSIGYAEITGVDLSVVGKSEASSQEGIFITNVVNQSNINADLENSKINYYIGTMLDSNITLGNTLDSTITYDITVYNKYDTDYIFIGVITDKTDSSLYSNTDIGYSLENLTEYVTTIPAQESITFSITFKYESTASLTNTTLASKLNFRFQEIPKLVLSNENQTYELKNIYPGYTPQEYTFTVSNYDKSKTNNVPLTYSFETTIDSPLTAKIYDSAGNEVTDSISIAGDGSTQTDHTYTLKIVWDANNNDSSYVAQNYSCNVKLNVIPDSDKYLEYQISKKFNVNISTLPFYFNATVENSTAQLNNYAAYFNFTTKNNDDTNFNQNTTTYDISLDDNNKFIFFINGEQESNNKITKTLAGGSLLNETFELKLIPEENSLLAQTETIYLVLKSTSPYAKEIKIPITITHNFNGNLFTDINRDTALLPTGFSVSSVASEKIITSGLVIKDNYDNEFVWVPIFEKSSEITWGIDYSAVTTAKTADNSSFTSSDITALKSALTSYTSTYTNTSYPDKWYGDSSTASTGYYNGSEFIYYSNGNMTKSEYETLYNNMLISLYKNGGFYVGRHEMGIGIADSTNTISALFRTNLAEYTATADSNSNTAPSIQNMITPICKINAVPYVYITQSQAQMLAQKMHDDYGYGNATCSLMFGIQWDSMCVFFEKYGVTNTGAKMNSSYLLDNTYSKLIGNFRNSEFTIDRGYFSPYANWSLTFPWLSQTTKQATTEFGLLTTGASEQNKVLNIYDATGNLDELTLEYSNSTGYPCSYRGGSFDDIGYTAVRAACATYVSGIFDSARISIIW